MEGRKGREKRVDVDVEEGVSRGRLSVRVSGHGRPLLSTPTSPLSCFGVVSAVIQLPTLSTVL